MKSIEISLGHAASHSPWLVHEPKNSSITSTMFSTRMSRSGWPWGSKLRWATLAAVNKLGGAVGAGGHTRPTADAGRGRQSGVGYVLGYRDQVGLGSRAGRGGDVAAGGDDPVEGGAIDHQVADDREGRGSPWFDRDGGAVRELPHMELAGRGASLGPMGLTIDHHPAASADALPTVMLEGDRFLALVGETIVEHVEHLEKAHVGRNVLDEIGPEPSRSRRRSPVSKPAG